jgi:hypothetical protein
MLRNYKIYAIAVYSLLIAISVPIKKSYAADIIIIVDPSDVKKTFSTTQKPLGFNATYLLDSDLHYSRSVLSKEKYRRTMAGALRFPFGHLANNYLWDTGTYGGELVPKVATMQKAPAKNMKWAINPDGTFMNAMDFDEFITICKDLGVEPLVVVNVMSHKYGGPSKDDLKTAAIE